MTKERFKQCVDHDPGMCITCKYLWGGGHPGSLSWDCRRRTPGWKGFPKVTLETGCGEYKRHDEEKLKVRLEKIEPIVIWQPNLDILPPGAKK